MKVQCGRIFEPPSCEHVGIEQVLDSYVCASIYIEFRRFALGIFSTPFFKDMPHLRE